MGVSSPELPPIYREDYRKDLFTKTRTIICILRAENLGKLDLL